MEGTVSSPGLRNRQLTARLLAVLTTALLLGWLLVKNAERRLADVNQNPQAYLATVRRVESHALGFYVFTALIVVIVMVVVVDGLTLLFGRLRISWASGAGMGDAPISRDADSFDEGEGPE